MQAYALLLAATLNAGTVLALAALGLLINEKAGIVNLGAEGIMLCAALAGFATVVHTGSDWLGFAAGAGAGALLAAAFGALVIWLGANQYAAGLALSLFGGGLSAFAGIGYVQERLPARPRFDWLGLGDVPFVGPALFRHHPLVYLTALLALALVWLLWRTRAGLVLRAVGEAPQSAHALGYRVRLIRLAAVTAGGAAGLAGALEVAGPLRQLTPNVPAGYGFAAIIVAFVGRLHPLGIVLAALLMSMFYIGGELAQSRLGLPKSITGVFQGLLLFALLACDTLVHYRIRRGGR